MERKHRMRVARALGLASALAAMAACGEETGGGGGDDAGGSVNVAAYEGTFLQGQCSPVRTGVSGRMRIVVTRVDDATITFAQNIVEFTGSDCMGDGVSAGTPTPLGTLVFDGGGANARVSFLRGTWTTPSSTSSRSVWALDGDDELCLLGDQEPTVFPTAASVEDYLDVLPASICYERL